MKKMKEMQIPEHLVPEVTKFLRDQEHVTVTITRRQAEMALTELDTDGAGLRPLYHALKKALG